MSTGENRRRLWPVADFVVPTPAGADILADMTTAVANIIEYTPEDLLEMDGLFELVDGQLVEKNVSYLAGKTASEINRLLGNFLNANGGGEVACEVTFQCFPFDPMLVRRPDLVVFSSERAGAVPDEGHVKIRPDIAIEIISPGDRINDFENKLADYRAAGIPLVWEVNPTFRYVRIHRPDRTTVLLENNDTLTGESVLPGFSATVGQLIPAAQ